MNTLCISSYEQSVCQMGVENANSRTVHKFQKNFSNDTDVTQLKFISQLVIQDETCIHYFDSESGQQSMQWNERIGENCHFITLRNSVFSMLYANNQWPLKRTKSLQPKTHIVHVVFWAMLLQETNTILILFWTELGQAENFLIAPHTHFKVGTLKHFINYYKIQIKKRNRSCAVQSTATMQGCQQQLGCLFVAVMCDR